MALPAWQATIVTGELNDGGNIIPSPKITVIVEATGQPAVLFSNRAGTGSLGNNGVFTGGVDGFAQFFAAPGEYRITASDAGSGFSQTWDFIVLSLPQISPSDVGLGRTLLADALDVNGGLILTKGSVNLNVFGGIAAGDAVFFGQATDAGDLEFYVPTSSATIPTSLTQVGTFSVSELDGTVISSGVGFLTVFSKSSNKLAVLGRSGFGSVTPGVSYLLITESASSKITVNF